MLRRREEKKGRAASGASFSVFWLGESLELRNRAGALRRRPAAARAPRRARGSSRRRRPDRPKPERTIRVASSSTWNLRGFCGRPPPTLGGAGPIWRSSCHAGAFKDRDGLRFRQWRMRLRAFRFFFVFLLLFHRACDTVVFASTAREAAPGAERHFSPRRHPMDDGARGRDRFLASPADPRSGVRRIVGEGRPTPVLPRARRRRAHDRSGAAAYRNEARFDFHDVRDVRFVHSQVRNPN
jgi:hypothetical protein